VFIVDDDPAVLGYEGFGDQWDIMPSSA